MKKTSRTWMLRLCALLALTIAYPVGSDAAYVILADGRRVEGTNIRARANEDVILTTANGDVTFVKGQYREAWGDQPPEMAQALRQLQAKRYDEVITAMEGVVTRMRGLSWDVEALALIGAAQVGKQDYAAAVTAYDRLFLLAPARREDPNVRWGYYEALMGVKQYDRLEGILNDLIAKGARPDAARAQVMRGDIKKARGMMEEGLLDYLRAVVFYKAEASVMPEALFKTAETLEAMRNPKAKEMYKRIVDEYGSSPYAQQARGKI